MTDAGGIAAALIRVGRQWRGRAAVRRLVAGGAGLAVLLALAATCDMIFRYGRAGRLIGFFLLAAALLSALAAVARLFLRPLSVEAVAARLERACPEFDNRLINYVQFARSGWRDAMVEAYLAQSPPDVRAVPIARLGDRRQARLAAAALAAAALVLAIGRGWGGSAWTNAMLRIINPLSDRPPVTLARILAVAPGDARALLGQPLTLEARVSGRPGVPVWVEIWPADDRRLRMQVGRVASSEAAAFAHTLPRVTAGLEYRFLAGDAASRRCRIAAVPPPAFARLDVRVIPPAYMGRTGAVLSALSERVVAPEGAALALLAVANRGMAAASAVLGSVTATLAATGADAVAWTGRMAAAAGRWTVALRDADGFAASAGFDVEIRPDPPPRLEILSPPGRVRIGPGGLPRVQWRATDDHGLTRVALEQLFPWDTKTPARRVAEWNAEGAPVFEHTWEAAETTAPQPGRPLVFRLAAMDTLPGAAWPRAVSASVVFEAAGSTGVAAAAASALADAAHSLGRMVELQRKNLAATEALEKAGSAATDAWNGVAAVQTEIFQTAEALLTDPARSLGALERVVRDLHGGPMREAIGVAARVPRARETERPALARRAVVLEGAILRALTSAEQGIDRVATHRRITGILSLLDALVAGQADALESTRSLAPGATAPRPLIVRQDRLAEDTDEFVRAARRDAEEMATMDAEFAGRLAQVATECERRAVARTMIAAAGHLEAGAPPLAVPLQAEALRHLKEFQSILNQWRAAEAEQRAAALREAVESAREAMTRLTDLQGKVVDAIRQTEQQKDRADREMEEFAEELGELKANMAEALLNIATDLHIFPELPVGNDLVADVYQIYEEVAQVPGSESTPASELGLQKEDWILEALERATERLDDMEMWLVSQPDAVKRNTENFDQQELPQIPVIPLASELEDIIGDLLEQEKEIMDQADDSATNQGLADMPAGWGIAEGEFANFSAKGKSGNERPEHKDQDGRSLVGRQGMSDGETVAGSGKINEGDSNIEARRTQDSLQSGQVQEEGHAEAKATGGGKGSGYSDRLGMAGTGRREDAKTAARSELGLQAMLRRSAEALYAKASMAHVRTGSLDEAVRAMQQAEDALRRGAPIREIREFQRRAVAALAKTQADIGSGVYLPVPAAATGAPLMGADEAAPADAAPPAYRDLVAEYFRSLSEAAP